MCARISAWVGGNPPKVALGCGSTEAKMQNLGGFSLGLCDLGHELNQTKVFSFFL